MKKLILIFLLLFSINGNSQKLIPNKKLLIDTSIYVDSISTKLKYVLLNHGNYENYYSSNDLVSLFVIYNLNPSNNNLHNYKSIFVKDPLINVSPGKYFNNSGYDRGHLFNAEDASLFNSKTFVSSYYITNATPQKPEFNRGIWKILEKNIRNIAKKDSLVIITGSDIFEEKLDKIKNVVSIPNYFFKVIINLSKNTTDIYYIPNKLCNNKLSDFLISKELFFEYTGIKLK